MKSKRIEDLPAIPGDKLRKAVELGICVVDGTYRSKRFKNTLRTVIDIEGVGAVRITDNPFSRFLSGFNEYFETWEESFSALLRWQALTKLIPKLSGVLKGGDETVDIPTYYFYAAGECPLHKRGGFRLREFLEISKRVEKEAQNES